MTAADGQEPLEAMMYVAGAEGCREAGNEKFRAGDVKAAAADYEEALKRLAMAHIEDPELETRAKACRVPAALNLALCCLRQEPAQAFRALELCEEVLEEDPKNAKATYRKGKALLEMGDLKEAEYELERAFKLAPGDAQVRQDLEKLRGRLKEMKVREKDAYQGIFAKKGLGFASDNREQAASEKQHEACKAAVDDQYDFLRDPADNPHAGSLAPHEEAVRLTSRGKLEEAVWAWEAAMSRAAEKGDWPAHFAHRLELGRLFMDVNLDGLALRCLNGAAGVGLKSGAAVAPPAQVRRHALLLRAVCLLNEAESDPRLEVCGAVEAWLEESGAASESDDVEERVARRRAEGGGADAAVAQGLLHLVSGRPAALQAFVDAVAAPLDEDSCFGQARRRAVKWNMLGAVLANQKRTADARAVYEQTLLLQPHYPRALVNHGISLRDRKEPLKAAQALTAALECSPGWAAPVMWPTLHSVAEETGDDALTEAALERNLARVRELLGPRVSAPTTPVPQATEVLAALGLAASAGAA